METERNDLEKENWLLREILRDVKKLWDQEGFGSDPNVSDALYARVYAATKENT